MLNLPLRSGVDQRRSHVKAHKRDAESYARKVRIALQEKGLPFELVTEVPWDSTTSTPKYNPWRSFPF